MRLKPVLIVALLARIADAQVADTIHRVSGATVSGVVRDSIARLPLVGAVVQLVAAGNPAQLNRSAISDSLGRFTLTDVPDGRHMLGFFHPMLDSLGVDAPLREVYVNGGREVRADLAIPSAGRLRAAICGERSARDSGTVVVGIVRDARDGMPVGGAKVAGEWVEISFRRHGLVRRVPRVVATTGDNGWFAMCNVPSAGTIALIASRGADSTDLIEVRVPPGGFLRHELYLGSARSSLTEGAMRTDTHRARTGNGILSGTIVTVAGGLPVAGAHVSITDGSETDANERGEWTLADAPAGTRMIDIRALGYYPVRRRVDVVSGAAPVLVALSTLKAVLDTVRVTASRLVGDDGGFQERRRSGLGRYLTPDDIMRRQPSVVSDLFGMMPGLHMEYDTRALNKRIVMRGAFGACDPSIYINGMSMTDATADSTRSGIATVTITADDLDTWMRPNDVTGIEVYSGDNVPPQYQQAMRGCGSILIWTKLRR